MRQTFPSLTNRIIGLALLWGLIVGLLPLVTWAQPPAGPDTGRFPDRARFTPGSTRAGEGGHAAGGNHSPDGLGPSDFSDPLSRPVAPLGAIGSAGEFVRPQLQSADGLVAELVSRLHSYQWISAKLRHKVTLLDQELVGSGNYLQQGRGDDLRLRWELKIQVADRTTSVQHVCDGNFLWLHEDLHDKTQLRRIDVTRLRQAVLQDRGAANPFAQARLAVGGLPKLLESLAASFQFLMVQQDRLDGVPVSVLRGTWRPAVLTATYPHLYKSAAADTDERTLTAKLPPQVPDVVMLFVGRDDLFPYRLEYRRRVRKDITDAEGRPSTVEETVPLLLMEWFEVSIDTPLDERNFIYRPGDLNYTDGTNKLLESWGLLPNAEK